MGEFQVSNHNPPNQNHLNNSNPPTTHPSGVPLTTIQWEKTPTPNVFSADLSSFSFSDVPGLHFPSLSQRGTVARFPNTPDPFQMNEEFSGDQRIAQGVATWLPPKPYKETDFSYVQIPGARDDTPDGWFQDYVHGVGGSCEVYDPPVSYWCSNATQGGGAFQFMIPSGIVLDESFLPNLSKYTPTSLNQAVVNAWRPARWENWMFEGDFDINSKTFTFNKGGFQGARGEKEGGDWFIENVFEELDSENEFFYNRSSKMLFFYVNASFTSSPDDYGVMVVPQEEGVFNILGASQSNPVKDLSIESVTITGTRHTYLTAPHSVPSGGDWALERRGAILLENTESTSIENVKINMVDGHGGQISGYNRNATFKGNHFSWVGGSAIVSWGRTDGETDEEAFSGMGGNWPRFNLIENNVAREVGHFEKQNSFYVQAKTAQSTIRNNLFFNGPRAGVNYNDGFGGGDVLEGNLIFNTCRESGDHGPFNSWDRQPFLTPVVDEDGSTAMEWRTIRSNFMIGNYQSQETVDNDDGSGYYLTEDNFLVYSSNGLKSDFGGHDNHHIGNIYAYVGSGSWGSGSCMSDGASQLDGHEDLYQNNFCVLSEGGDYGSFDASTAYPKMGDNDIYVSGEDDVGTVGLNGMALADFQAANPGVDDGSTVALLDDWEIIINKGRALLGL